MTKSMNDNRPDGQDVISGLKFCGCGNPDRAYAALLEVLKVHDGGDGRPQTWEQRCDASKAWWAKLGSDYAQLVLYFLDAAELTEHGSGVGGCWLTNRGKAAVAFLERHGTEPDNWPDGGSS